MTDLSSSSRIGGSRPDCEVSGGGPLGGEEVIDQVGDLATLGCDHPGHLTDLLGRKTRQQRPSARPRIRLRPIDGVRSS